MKPIHHSRPARLSAFNSFAARSTLSFIFLFSALLTKAQTTLVAGDIAVIGFNTSFNINTTSPIGGDQFAIVALRDINSGTVINITDRGWNGSSLITANSGDGNLSWTTTLTIPKGTIFRFIVTSGLPPSVAISPTTYGTPVITSGWNTSSFLGAMANAGDQVIVYQGGTETNPGTFIYGFNSSASTVTPAGNWQIASVSVRDSDLPPGLTNNTLLNGTVAASAVAFTNNSGGYYANNFVYTGVKAGNKDALLKAIANRANWTYTTTPTTTYDLLPAGAFFTSANPVFSMSTLPVYLLNFSGSRMTSGHMLQWKVAREEHFLHYIVEKSTDGSLFVPAGIVSANGSSDYSFFVPNSSQQRSYYRLKMVDDDTKFKYSRVILLMGNEEKRPIHLYPNPTTDGINISSNSKIKEVSITDMHGHHVLKIAAGGTQAESISLQKLIPGAYLVRVKTDRESYSYKIMKQ
jgi:hypothetical protein